ncbi:NET1-associated nuclear protein 1 [Malassezia vespertilionis]|uniref:WD repeat-containing protein 75 second beta-propeller domain-containing protein n=1 Tax=Malassezia vespertilionis TaxID=2020962 RepID=A0A2N1JBM8_9BASI|nr:NET1-associated nuclear protein 1 [Malassezia vespertilionis]PKI83948.1 hypothetical protein MVES_002062 [Malassezia vespertilionis]WFD06832.1 NET1-associated nuclear protein 1 [Malassezia vespertilionis]
MPARKKATPDPPIDKDGSPVHVDLEWSALQDEICSSIPPVFTRDGSYAFLVRQASVLILSRATNKIVSSLSGESTDVDQRHTLPITGMLLSPFNPLQLITTSLDGCVKTWDYLDAELHDSVQIGHPICAVSANTLWKHRLFLAATKRGADDEGKPSTTIYSVQLGRASPTTHKPSKLVRLGKARQVTHLAVSPDGAWLVALGATKVHVLSLHDTTAGFVKYAAESQLTALAFHPDTSMPRFATGEKNGKIRIWYCLDPGQRRDAAKELQAASPTTTLHWHAHAVAALEYTPDGAQLLSGGEEGVLVLWRLHSGNVAGNDDREYVPRLGAGIVALAVAPGFEQREQAYVVRLADSSVVFIASLSLKPVHTFAPIKCDATRALLTQEQRAALPHPLALDRAAGHLVTTAGHPSTLQFIDHKTHEHIRDVEIVPSNRISRPEDEALAPPRVLHVALSGPMPNAAHAEWMATIDGRDNGAFTGELLLKFWHWDAQKRTFLLNTRIDYPHEHRVTAMCFSPCLGTDAQGAFLLLTAGTDGQVKTWRMAQRALKGARAETYWVCRSSFAYRDTVPHDVTWAPDGSLFAVAQGVFVTLWDPHTLIMQARLAAPELRSVRKSVFVGRKGRFLASLGSNHRMVVWDLVAQRVVYSALQRADDLVAFRDGVLAMERDQGMSYLRFIRPHAAVPHEATYRIAMPLRSAPLVLDADAAAWVAWSDAGALIGARLLAPSRSLHGVQLTAPRATLFDELFGVDEEEQKRVDKLLLQDRAKLSVQDDKVADALALFETPAHLLPPMSMLLDPFLDALLPKAEKRAPSPVRVVAAVEEPVQAPTTLSTLDRIAHVRNADMAHLASAFDTVLGAQPPSLRTSKTKRRTQKGM